MEDPSGLVCCLFMGFGFVALPAAFIVLIVMAFRYNARIQKERADARRMLADRWGLGFDARHDPRLMDAMSPFKLFNLGHSRSTANVAWGRLNGMELTCFDYRYVTGGGKSSHLHLFTVIAFLDVGEDLPHYRVWPRSAMDWLRLWTDSNEFRLGDERFDERCCLAGEQRGRIGRLLDDSLVRFHLDNPDLQVEADRERLIIYHSLTTAYATQDLLDRAFDLLDLVRRSARRE
jgi:hypothetical protein